MSGDTRIVRTVTPRAGYGAEPLLAHIQDGRLVKVEGDPDDRTARGQLSSFASRYVERVYSRERILHPLRRVGEPGSADFVPISWDEALDLIAEALEKVARGQDPRAVFHYGGNGQDGVMTQFSRLFFSYYGGYSTVYGDLCNSAGMEALRLTFGTLLHNPPENYRASRMIILWGKNPVVTHPQQVAFLEKARERGTRLVCIDPRRTRSAEACDEHLAPRPGTDGFFANSLAHVLFHEGLVDEDFARRHIQGLSDYRWLVRNYAPEKAAQVCEIEADRIVAFARAFGAAKPANINVGFGVQRYRNGGQTVRAIAALQAITGNIGVPGGGLDYFNQAAFVTRPYPFDIPAPPRVRQLGPASRMGRVLLRAKEPPVRAAIIERGNPMAQSPFASAVHYALTRMDFVCVIDQFLTDTARRAHLVLPAKSMFEELDLVPNPWDGVLRLKRKCIAPPGEARTEREIYQALAERMGYPIEQFGIDPEEMLNCILPPGLSVRRLKKRSFDRYGPEFVPFSNRKFPTPSGKIELKSESAEVSWRVDPLPFYTPPRESAQTDPERYKRFPLHLLTPKTEDRFLSQWAHDESMKAPEETRLEMHPEDAAARGLAEGDGVRVFNDRGEVRLPVRLDPGLKRGVVVLPQGRWIARDGFSVNVLTHDDITDMGYGAIYFDCLVEVEPGA